MTYLICLFFPSFICLKSFIKKSDEKFDIFIKYIYINIIVNFLAFVVVFIYSRSNSIIDNNIMTIPFFIKYLLVSSVISFMMPKLYVFFKKDFSIKVEIKK